MLIRHAVLGLFGMWQSRAIMLACKVGVLRARAMLQIAPDFGRVTHSSLLEVLRLTFAQQVLAIIG